MNLIYRAKKIFFQKSPKAGFTLIELIVAISIFIVVMTISMGSILSVFDGNRRSRSLRTVIGNLNLAVESMSKEMRFGRNYHCSSTTSPGTLTVPQNCASGETLMSFLSTDNNLQVTYRLNLGRIEKLVGAGSYTALTAPEIIIDGLTFYTVGALTGDSLQPKVIILIKAHAGANKSRSDFTIETMVSQRRLDM